MPEPTPYAPHAHEVPALAPRETGALKFLLVDDDDIILGFARICLEDEFPEAEITDYPTLERAKPGPDFDWSAYDLLLLDYNLGNGETGIGWLEEFGRQPGFPKTILLTAVTDPYVVGNAVRSGAQAYLNKANLEPSQLVAAVRDVLGPGLDGHTQAPAPHQRPGPTGPTAPATSLGTERLGHTGSYRIRSCIGRGAMSSVYIAERVEDQRTVAIKVLEHALAEDPSIVQRFVREGEVVMGIGSPQVVRIYEQGFTNRYGFIAMEFFGRGDLKQQIGLGIRPAAAIAYLDEILRGLEAIHGAGIVHRDLKPANVMFRSDGSLALVDFGIAKPLEEDLSLTATGTVLGTPHYMSPEQARGASVDRRSDLYAAGAILYEMLTGRRPYEGRSLTAVVFQQVYAPVPVLPAEHARYQPLLERMMAKEPDARARSAAELREDLARMGLRRQ